MLFKLVDFFCDPRSVRRKYTSDILSFLSFRYHMLGQAQLPFVMPTFTWADSPKPWARKTWNSCFPNMVASSHPESLWTKLQVQPYSISHPATQNIFMKYIHRPLAGPIRCTKRCGLWCQGSHIGLFSYSEQAYHEEWASSGLTSEMKQKRPSKDWMDRSLWVLLSP